MGAFSAIFINRPIFAMVISIVIVLLGSLAIPLLPVESMPNITPPTVKVTANYPGASAQVVEETVASPIEQEVNGVENMIYMASTSSGDGSMSLTVSFKIGTDPDMSTVLTQNRVNIAEPLLPEEVKRQGIKVKKQSTQMILMVALTSPDGRYDDVFLSNYATTQVKDILSRQDGVGEVMIFGAKDFGMRIWLDPAKVKARGLTTDDVLAALREQNVQVAAGQIGAPPMETGANFQYNITTQGRLSEVEQFENIIVKVDGAGAFVRVRDIGRVELGAQNYSWYAQLDGAPATVLGIYQRPGANAMQVSDDVQATMETLSQRFPPGLSYAIPHNSTRYIRQSISEVITTLLVAVLLVVLVVYIFLQDFRSTLVPVFAIPVSLVGTFGVLLAAGFSINNLTLFGLILAIGIVVDDSIMVTENTMRIMDEEGLPPKEAAAKTMREVGGAVVATTAVLLAVFIPTMVMPGLTGLLYRQFAMTISVATVLSSVNALTLSPALCGMLLRPPDQAKKKGRFFSWFNRHFDTMSSGYMKIVNGSLRKSKTMMGAFAVILVAMVLGFAALPAGFVPGEDEGYFFVNAELPAGASLERTAEVMDRVNETLMNTPGVQNVVTIGGYSLLNGTAGTNTGFSIVTLDHWDDRPGSGSTLWGLLRQIQPQFAQIREGIVFGFPPPPIAGLGAAGGFEMQLQDRGGIGIIQMETFANDLVAAGTQSPVLTRLNQSFRANVPQYFTEVDREKVKSLGVSLQSVFGALQANLGSAYVNDFNLFGRTWRVMVQADQAYRAEADDIGRLEVRDAMGNMIPVGTLASVRDTVGPQTINRFNMFRSATLTGTPNTGFSDGQATDEIERLAGQTLPPQMGYEWSGVTFQQKEAGNMAPLIFSLAILFAFLFLAAQYESWANPLSVMLSVPMAILGAVGFTYVRGFIQPMENNVYTQVGIVLLIALSAKTAILIVEFAKQQHEREGKGIIEAASEAARLRFRPILMTAFSFILGVIPLMIATGAGAKSRVSLGTGVFGGMLVYTILGVFFIPSLYAVVELAWTKLFRKPKQVSAGDALESQA
ncbi:MAG: multidrug efflux RND transporter permease subunit [Gemmatimonadetes bacterium]|nr:multidrug efflux RND transporter permease subunit [Gemmatimonadota bacterium]MCZ6918525.1 multidrug efflux RND transporter permease subunit [Gemmatimonadota bacterium]